MVQDGWSHNMETFHNENSGVFNKNPRKRKFYYGCPSSRILVFKKTNIFTIFPAKISNILKYFLSETIHAQENGSRGTYFAKFLIFNFLDGLTYSAMVP